MTSIGLSPQTINAVKEILKNHLDKTSCEQLVAKIDAIYKNRFEGFQRYKEHFPEQIPLKKKSDEYKELEKLHKTSTATCRQITLLSSLSSAKLDVELGAANVSQEIAAIKGYESELLLYPSGSNLDIEIIAGLLSTLNSAISTAMTNSRSSDKHRKSEATLDCWLIRKVEYCVSSRLGDSISFDGGAGTPFERIIAEVLGCNAQDKIRNCHRKLPSGKKLKKRKNLPEIIS